MPNPQLPNSGPPAFEAYAVPGVGTVIAHEGAVYVVLAPNNSVYGYTSASGTPRAEIAAAEIAAAIAAPPAFPVAVPASVTRRQLFLWLNASGVTRAQIRGLLAGDEAALIEFDEALEFRRDHPLVAQLGATFGLTAAQVDAGFRAAAAL
jgi:hypothetical protein